MCLSPSATCSVHLIALHGPRIHRCRQNTHGQFYQGLDWPLSTSPAAQLNPAASPLGTLSYISRVPEEKL